MSLRVVGAGLGRTGTLSLKLALERLLGGPCYHMLEVIARPEHIEVWDDAVQGRPVDWDALFDGYRAAVDWPVCAFWEELATANPDAIVLLSTRADADAWWTSASQTIFAARKTPPDPMLLAHREMTDRLLDLRFTPGWRDAETAKAAYEQHNAAVRATVPPERLLDWQPGDGWAPICDALGVDVPDEPFPHANSTEEFRIMVGLDPPPAS